MFHVSVPTISFRAPLTALRARLFLTLNLLFPYSKRPPVPTNAIIAAVHARCAHTQSCKRSTNGGVGAKSSRGRCVYFREGLMEAGSHDWRDAVSRRCEAALSTCRSIDSATFDEYLFTSFGIEASWEVCISTGQGAVLLVDLHSQRKIRRRSSFCVIGSVN